MNYLPAFNYIHFTHPDQLKGFPTGGNFVAFSELESFHAPMVRREVIGLKYVIAGEENYVVNGFRHKVKPGQLLIVDELESGEAFNNRQKAIGICINVDKKLIQEVLNVYRRGDSMLDEDRSVDEQYNFFQDVTPAAQLSLGNKMDNLAMNLPKITQPLGFIEKDFFYELSELLIQDHSQLQAFRLKIPASKKITQQEISKRLLIAKEIVDSGFEEKLDLDQLAAHAGMSTYHFCRSFKAAFGVSPYKYILTRRLQEAERLLACQTYSVTEVAEKCGFTDIYTFSKAFKKQFGFAPSFLAGFDKL